MAAADFLIDTGAILAILDRKDRWHLPCLNATRQLRLPGLTSEAVLTEVFHLLRRSRVGEEATWTFIRSGVVTLASIEDSELHRIRALMAVYSDRPMDFADATLVYLAERESMNTILTVDHDDFQTYRIAGKQLFRVLPIERP
jgi:uncharacterized protein